MRQLSALTPPVVDHLFGIDTATPVSEPEFIFVVGVPGAGKSSVHRAGLLPVGNYATINLDTLLEAVEPFRAGSSMAHALKSDDRIREKIPFASIFGYGTHKENLGMFDWYDRTRPGLMRDLPEEELSDFNAIRERFRPLQGHTAAETIIAAAAAAIQRAIHRHINIVYETTLTGGRTTKVDEIVRRLPASYRVSLYHVVGTATDVAERIRARQEYHTPYNGPYPFYRYVTTNPVKIQAQLDENRTAIAALRRKYKKTERIRFLGLDIPLNPAVLPKARAFNARTQRQRIVSAYGPQTRRHRHSSSLIPSSWRVSSTGSSTFRLSSSSSSEKRRRTRRSNRTP